MSARIDCDHAIISGEFFDLLFKIAAFFPVSMKQDQGFPFSLFQKVIFKRLLP